MTISSLAKRRVGLWGLGREGMASYQAIRRQLPTLPLMLLSDQAQPVESPLAQDPYVAWACGEQAIQQALTQLDLVVKSPGVSGYRTELVTFQHAGGDVTSATNLAFSEGVQGRVLAITGTKGKSTAASLAQHLLTHCGYAVGLAGNIGQPLLEVVGQPQDIWVLELSSYQIADLCASLDVAVVLNLYPEHLDWHGSLAQYYADKLRLVTQLKPQGVAVLNAQQRELMPTEGPQRRWFQQAEGYHVREQGIFLAEQCVLPTAAWPFRGVHNASNCCAVLTALAALGIEVPDLAHALEGFTPLPHRLMSLGVHAGLEYVDDSISTTPQSTQAALEAFSGRAVGLILGGQDRGLDWGEFAQWLLQQPLAGVSLVGESGACLHPYLAQAQYPVQLCQDMAQAVEQLRQRLATPGVILLSPAAPSYDMFTNYQQRGQAFAQQVMATA